VNDCGEGIDDDEAGLCPWLADIPVNSSLQSRRFTCRDGTSIDIGRRCDQKQDCRGNGWEDELFCDLEQLLSATPYELLIYGVLSDIIVHPPLSSQSMTVTTTAHTKVDAHERSLREKTKIISEPIRIKSYVY